MIKRIGQVRLARIRRDVRELSAALDGVDLRQPDAASLLRTLALRAVAVTDHLMMLALDLEFEGNDERG